MLLQISKFLLVFTALIGTKLTCLSTNHDKLSPLTSYFILTSDSLHTRATTTFDIFIETIGTDAYQLLEQLHIQPSIASARFAGAKLTISEIEQLSDMPDIARISLARKPRLLLNKVREYTNQQLVLEGYDKLKLPYTGQGVIYGTFDEGIQFNHPAFTDSTGIFRFNSIYLAENSDGKTISGTYFNDYGELITTNLPGSEFSAHDIARLKYDTTDESHGTHTIAIATGRDLGNNLYGMAPDCEIIACAQLSSELDMLNGVAYMMNKAQQTEKPIVVNLSLGVNSGRRDGSDAVTTLLNSLCGEGRIITIAAGNEGDYRMHINHTFTSESDTLRTFFIDDDRNSFTNLVSSYNYESEYGYEIYSRDGTPFSHEIIIYDKSTGEYLYKSQILKSDASRYSFINIPDELGGGMFAFFPDVAHGGCTILFSDVALKRNLRIGMNIFSTADNTIDVWSDCYGLGFDGDNVEDFVTGDSNGSINTWACGDNTISVGSYYSKDSYTNSAGQLCKSPYSPGVVSSFSSHGPDGNGRQRPEVLAPGSLIASAINGYDSNYKPKGSLYSDVVYYNATGATPFSYGIMEGTSMAAPAVAGIIATWLQANPHLSPTDILDVIEATAIADDFTLAETSRSGFGKIDAYAGLVKVINESSVLPISPDSGPQFLIYPNPNSGIFKVAFPTASGAINIDIFNLQSQNVYSTTISNNGNDNLIDVSNRLIPGIYILRCTSGNQAVSSKLVIK